MHFSLPTLTILATSMLGTVWGKIFFEERFNDGNKWEKRWETPTTYEKGPLGKLVLSSGKWFADEKLNAGLQTSDDARFYAISAKFPPFNNKGKTLVVQMSVKHEQEIDCGGGYIKILPAETDQSTFHGDSKYFIMFGPDICGTKRQVQVIINHNGKNHLIKKYVAAPSDTLTHIYTLIIRPDETYSVFVDGEEETKGLLSEDWSFLPPKTIPDPEAKKPSDWVDQRDIDDPEAKKPEDWNENLPRQIPDASAVKPSDWDDDMYGEWTRPTIDNPEWKDQWKPEKIKNPAYKGPWTPPQIPNPEFHTDASIGLFEGIGAVGIDIWQVKSGTIFDNILVTDDVDYAEKTAKQVYKDLKEKEESARDAYVAAKKLKDEEELKAKDSAKEAVDLNDKDNAEKDESDEGMDKEL